ncbi:MAG TPA: glycosyltransferase family 87 protein [candidate division Zixibacteria bacterium]|nr:glycosyltransferase family 87 protein [candidate division Zixibacteria bacterium]
MTPTGPMTPTRLLGAYALVAGLVAAVFVGGILLGNFRAVERSDYMTYHVAARLVLEGRGDCLYDVDCQASEQRELIGEEPSFERGALPYNSPPWFAALVAPLGALPLGVGFAVFTLLGVVVLAAGTSRLAAAWNPLLAPLLVLTAWPTAMAVIRGQLTLLVAGLLALSVAAATYRSGVWLGLSALKPTLGPMWAAWQLLRWHPRAVGTAVVVLLALVALSAVVVSPQALLDYPAHLLGVAGTDAVGVHVDEMVNWRGAAERLGVGGWLVAAGTLLSLALVAWVWLRTDARCLGAAAAFLATPLVIPHANQHEAVLAAIGVLLLVTSSGVPRALAIAAVASHAATWVGVVLDAPTAAWLLFALQALWLVVAAWWLISRQERFNR